ncbi:FAD-binding oxidoreductase [Rhodobacteraceae bacterium HSP-20]|uniref:FAD-binding oxidoreductase n=1 Tax=Paragemmobacter amnigenus TaxID=2852097 RepID=A0ABS6J651_9RHOB|nr:FAD-binding oxidoreductase [Rhodobacter amnigenus]MBU9698701.1 FAD-binding oxidoreductase [Rhodobacter amnigenus]MBV4389928.1 FAD-binding oxidoreductase [Rhodobacter amnigenus]
MLNPADAAFAATLAALLPGGAVRAPEPRYLEEPRGRWRGQGGVLVLPRSVAEVQAVVRACAEARVGIVPWGGGTGLVGGQVLPDGPAPVILSLERMAAVRHVWPGENALEVEAGATLAAVQEAAAGAGRLFPLSLASEGTARIGGVLATNAGGIGVLRYGNARDLCLGVEAVLADGSVIGGLKRLRKDNTGYDLRNLLIGAEGSLGIITAATLRMVPRPAVNVTAMLVVESPAAALRLLTMCQGRVPGMVSAFELIKRTGFEFLAAKMPEVGCPFPVAPDWCVLLELGLPSVFDAEEVMAGLYAEADEAGLVQDGVIAASEAQRQGLWRIRESIPEANRLVGAVSSHDISLPLSAVPEFIARADAALAGMGAVRVNCFGHLGDGNLHYNVFPAEGRDKAGYDAAAVMACVHDLVDAMGGSVSAEHGVGRLKVGDLERYGDAGKLAAMRAVKAALDPLGIMNPGAVLR